MAKALNISLIDEDVTRFFTDVIQQAINHRRETGTKRNDFIDLILNAIRDEGKKGSKEVKEVEGDQFEKDAEVKSAPGLEGLSDEEFESLMVSNLFVFFFAGFETSSLFLSVILWVCARYPEEQERLRAEIDEYVEKNDGSTNLDYMSVQEMPFMDMFVSEALRMYPITILERQCVKDYKVPGTNGVIKKGMIVQIPGFAIMKDPAYFKNPEEFNPENFSPESKAERNPYAFLIFGQGPRNCIGMRFALLMLKMCVVKLLHTYRILPSEKTPEKLEIDPLAPGGAPKGGTWIKLEKR